MTGFYLPWGFNTAPAICPDGIQPSIHLSPDKVSIDIIVFPQKSIRQPTGFKNSSCASRKNYKCARSRAHCKPPNQSQQDMGRGTFSEQALLSVYTHISLTPFPK